MDNKKKSLNDHFGDAKFNFYTRSLINLIAIVVTSSIINGSLMPMQWDDPSELVVMALIALMLATELISMNRIMATHYYYHGITKGPNGKVISTPSIHVDVQKISRSRISGIMREYIGEYYSRDDVIKISKTTNCNRLLIQIHPNGTPMSDEIYEIDIVEVVNAVMDSRNAQIEGDESNIYSQNK